MGTAPGEVERDGDDDEAGEKERRRGRRLWARAPLPVLVPLVDQVEAEGPSPALEALLPGPVEVELDERVEDLFAPAVFATALFAFAAEQIDAARRVPPLLLLLLQLPASRPSSSSSSFPLALPAGDDGELWARGDLSLDHHVEGGAPVVRRELEERLLLLLLLLLSSSSSNPGKGR